MKREGAWVQEGLVTGLVGYITVVAFFAILNMTAGEDPFHTAALLGSALFFGLREPAQLISGPAPIIAYNGIHILASLLIGLGAAWLIFRAEKNHPLWYGVFFVFLAGFIYSVVAMGVFASEIVHLLSWPVILLANVAAGLTAGAYLWSRHRALLTRLHSEDG